MRSGSLLLGAATLKHDYAISPCAGCGGAPDNSASRKVQQGSGGRGGRGGRGGAVYLSGFRIVQDALATRHAEYRIVIVDGRYERWHRFSELKALARLPALSGDCIPEASREAWESVRACKAPKGRTLDPRHLSRKCLAIERFLRSLLEEVPAERLAALLTQVPTPRRVPPRTKNWGAPSVAYLAAPTTLAARATGLKMRMR